MYNCSMEAPRRFKCVLCSKRTKAKERRLIDGPGNKPIRKFLRKTFMIDLKEGDVICNKCKHVYYKDRSKTLSVKSSKNAQSQTNTDNLTLKDTTSPSNITLPLSSLGGSHSQCFLCKKKGPKLLRVPAAARNDILIEKLVILPPGARCCPGHLEENLLTSESYGLLDSANLKHTYDTNRTGVLKLIEGLANSAKINKHRRLDFDDNNNLDNNDYCNLTGLTMSQFDDLCANIKIGSIRETKLRSVRTCIGMLLMKLKTGMSNNVLATLFSVSKTALRRAINSARTALARDFVPYNLGFQHVTREEIINNHTRPIAQTLFGVEGNPPAIVVIDGTYIFIQKSTQFAFQRRTFSQHKHRSLVKPMVFVSTTGYVVSVLGPYLSDPKNNDAKILNSIFQSNIEEIQGWLKEDDIIVVDRGFRDSIELLESEFGIKCKMPAFNKGTQFSDADSNSSRLVTKVRWVVESFNGRLKKWQYLDKVLPNSQIPYIGDYTRLVAAISNKYKRRLNDGESESDLMQGCKMLYLAKQSNVLKAKVESSGIIRQKKIWKSLDACDPSTVCVDFPRLTEDEIRGLTLGVYQLKMAKLYTQEHVDEHGAYEIFINNDDPFLLCAKLNSRHISTKEYKLFIEYELSSVKSWYCTCRAGARVVGMCSHCAAVVWFLAYARHQDNDWRINKSWFDFVEDAQKVPEEIDCSDDETVYLAEEE